MQKILVLAVLLPLAACQGGHTLTAPSASPGCGIRHGCGTQDLTGSPQSGTEPLSRTDGKPPPVYGEQCPKGSGSDTASAAQVLLTAQSPQPKVTIPAGRAFAVRVTSDRADVTEPQSYDPKTVCRLSVALNGRTGTAMFLAVRPGATRIAATITGIPGGLEHPAYGADITVK